MTDISAVNQLRKDVISMCYSTQTGHIASSLSVLEIIFVLYKYYIKPKKQDIILSKGHAAPALYTVLHHFNIITQAQFQSYCSKGSYFNSHPTSKTPGVLVSSGALGLGLSIGAGLVQGNILKRDNKRVYVVMGDGEWNEGSVWEALMYIGHHQLPITVIMDKNGLQASNFTRQIINTQALINASQSLGWHIQNVDGHNITNIKKCLDKTSQINSPVLVIAETIKGKGVSFMENNPQWHHRQMTEKEYKLAMDELMI